MADAQHFTDSPAADPASSTPPVYDAAMGFRDIKPLPQFSPVPVQALLISALLLGLAALAAFLLLRRRKQEKLPAAQTGLAPEQAALAELRRIEQARKENQITIRELALDLSLTMRQYAQAALAFPAVDLTPREIDKKLPGLLRRALPNIAREKLDDYRHHLISLLRFCERAAFASNPETYYSLESDVIAAHLQQSQTLVRQLASWLKKELERRTGVVAQSKLGAQTAPAKGV